MLIGVIVQVVGDVKVTVATFQKSFAEQLPAEVPASARLLNVAVGTVLVVLPQKTWIVAIRPAAFA